MRLARVFFPWVPALAALALGVRSWLGPVNDSEEWAPAAQDAPHRPPTDTSPLPAASYIAEHNPFRVNRRPSDPQTLAGGMAEAPRAEVFAPELRVTGLIGGPPWTVILTGIPGVEGGAVLSVGDSVGPIRVLDVRSDTVLISVADSILALPSREAPT